MLKALLLLATAAGSTPYREVDVCFVLDTTGSMSAAIETAKEKIWFIATEIANEIAAERGSTDQNPNLRVCLMAFRDRGDEYVTQLTPLTPDLDRVEVRLQALTAGGGGDGPEAVHQALWETVRQTGWRSGDEALRVIFLIGDAPPKDYPDEPNYTEIVAEAAKSGIVINPVLIGQSSATRRRFANLRAGDRAELLDLPLATHSRAPSTPLDQDLIALGSRLDATLLPYGSVTARQELRDERARAEELSDLSRIDRLAFGEASGRVLHRPGDLLQDLDAGRIQLDELSQEQLPAALRSMSREELQASLGAVRSERAALSDLIQRLLADRRKLIEHSTDPDSFEYQVTQVLLRQL
ncbi:MAG: vWA domain-containing protein [Pseudomonadota bacterium]